LLSKERDKLLKEEEGVKANKEELIKAKRILLKYKGFS